MNKDFDIIDALSIWALAIGVYSLILAMQNLEENRLQTEDTKQILQRLNIHLAEQDRHLAKQDELLLKGVNNGNKRIH